MKVRPARRGELPAIRALIALYPKQLVQDTVPKLKHFYVAEVNGQIAGCCALEIYSRRIAEVRSLSVAPEFQGLGLATALIGACLRRAKARRIFEVFTITGSIKLFARLGFRAFNREKFALFKHMR
jgi:amino-acid N-acetyltransferase